MKKTIFILLIPILFSYCDSSKYDLKWKLPNNEKIIYETYFKIEKDKSSVPESNVLDDLVKIVKKAKNDTMNMFISSKDIYREMIEQNNALVYVSVLKPQKDYINLEFSAYRNKRIQKSEFPSLTGNKRKIVLYNGKIKKTGAIESIDKEFFQNHLMNIMFEMPEKSVSVGESWPLNIELLKLAATKGYETINKVTLTDVIEEGDDKIAILEYELNTGDIKNNILFSNFSFTGNAKFDLNKGKWIYFEGKKTDTGNGFMKMKQVRTIKLVEIPESKYNEFQSVREKQNTRKVIGKDTVKRKQTVKRAQVSKVEKSNKENKPGISVDCPIIYSVQILASDEPVALNSKVFNGLKYKVEQLIVSGTYKYKYIVGSECSKEKAIILRDALKSKGFDGAYIIKSKNRVK